MSVIYYYQLPVLQYFACFACMYLLYCIFGICWCLCCIIEVYPLKRYAIFLPLLGCIKCQLDILQPYRINRPVACYIKEFVEIYFNPT